MWDQSRCRRSHEDFTHAGCIAPAVAPQIDLPPRQIGRAQGVSRTFQGNRHPPGVRGYGGSSDGVPVCRRQPPFCHVLANAMGLSFVLSVPSRDKLSTFWQACFDTDQGHRGGRNCTKDRVCPRHAFRPGHARWLHLCISQRSGPCHLQQPCGSFATCRVVPRPPCSFLLSGRGWRNVVWNELESCRAGVARGHVSGPQDAGAHRIL